MDAATAAILVALVGGPSGAVILSHYIQPKKTVPEQIETLHRRQEESDRRTEQLENDFRLLQDYTHDLRQHIASNKPPPPPPWPEGLTQ